jgi:hypothetical protein
MGKRLTSILNLMVACAREGRTIASIGAYLTQTEQEQIPEVYSRLKDGEVIDENDPAIAFITSKKGRKSKISQGEAINWFIERYPKWSLPLQKKLQEKKPPKVKTILAYGLKEGEDFNDEFYVEVIRDVANIPEIQARHFYEDLLKPQLSRLDELSGLLETEMKPKSS